MASGGLMPPWIIGPPQGVRVQGFRPIRARRYSFQVPGLQGLGLQVSMSSRWLGFRVQGLGFGVTLFRSRSPRIPEGFVGFLSF